MERKELNIVCAGGGTLGSVTPLLSVLAELKKQLPAHKVRVVWFGTARGPEKEVVQNVVETYITLPAAKWRRYFSIKNITDLGLILFSFIKCLIWFTRNQVDMVLTAGSFVALPVGLVAKVMGVPLVVHQQDVKVVLTNKILGRVANLVTVTFPESIKDFPNGVCRVVGNPVRSEFLNQITNLEIISSQTFSGREQFVMDTKNKLGLVARLPILTVVGGGTGAVSLNQIIYEALPELVKNFQVIHITGQGNLKNFFKHPHYFPFEFVSEAGIVFKALQVADLVITRAGMAFLTELGVLGKSIIVVPLPSKHQEANAELIENKQAGVYVQQLGLTSEQLVATVNELWNDTARRQKYAENLAKLFPKDGAERMAGEVLRLLNDVIVRSE